MPEIQYPTNPNSDTAFVVQDDGKKNRALMIAPQDISTLELSDNPNSTKGYVTIDGKKHRVNLVADITGGGGGGSSLPDQTGHSGEFLTTDGTDASWAAVESLPTQTGNAGKFLTTDGTDASWSDKPLVNRAASAATGVVIGTDSLSWGGSGVAVMGFRAKASQSNTTNCIAIGCRAEATNGAIQLSCTGSGGSNANTNTFKVANANGNYEIMSADGTIPADRLASTTGLADGNYRLRCTITNGVPTLSWVAE